MYIAVDVGGTFTDLVVYFEDGSVVGYKTPSTRPDIIQGLFNGVDLIAQSKGVTSREIFARLKRLDFGTTAATNALLEGKAARTGLIVTEGFRDVLVVREEGKADSYDMKASYPEPYLPRSLTFEVSERMTAEGQVLKPLDEGTVLNAICGLRAAEVEAVAISLIWSIANPKHELRLAELVRRELPGVAVSVGHEVNPCLREYRRTISCAIDASLKPLVAMNVALLKKRLDEVKFAGKLTYVTSSGGKAAAADITRRPVYLCFSGPSAAPESGRRFAQMEEFRAGNVVTIDMGGTSFDVSIVTGGNLPIHREGVIAGHMFGVPSVEIHSIGAGGGSIARVDAGGFLHVGPESAGSRPGPACYNRGGTLPTVTDANLVAGYLSERFSAGGGMGLSRELAERAIKEHVARPLRTSIDEAASLIGFACEHAMVAAIEEITIKRGIDPREYVMVAGGAAAGAHAISIAREIGIKRLIVPKMAGVLSAYGILAGDVTFSFARSFATSTDNFDRAGVLDVIGQLTQEGRGFLKGMEVAKESQHLIYTCQARYQGQVWELSLPMDPMELGGELAADMLAKRFHELHRSRYQTASEGETVEVTEWNLLAVGKLSEVVLPELPAHRSSGPIGRRVAHFRAPWGAIEAPIYGPLSLPIEKAVRGPMLIDEELTTIVVSPDATVRLSRFGNYVIEID
jgi:N-methylhydantoinase A